MRKTTATPLLTGCLAAVALLIAGCGSGGSSAASSTNPATVSSTPTVASTATTTASASGFAQESPGTIVAAATKALSAAESFSAQGVVDSSGVAAPVTLEVQRPSSVLMSLTQGAGQVVKVTVVGQKSWLWANAAFWKHNGGSQLSSAEISQQLADRWFLAPAAEAASLTSKVKDITSAKLAVCLQEAMVNPHVVGVTSVAGQSVVELRTAGGSPGQSPGNLYVATAPPHNVVRFQQTGKAEPGGTGACASGPTDGDGTGNLVFSGWNATTVTAPVNAPALP